MFFKKTIRDIVSQDYQLEFLGDNFEKIVKLLSPAKANSISGWVKRIIIKEIQPILARKSKNKYKKWPLNEILSFRKEINIEKSNYRVMLLKVKNSFYIEFHLSHHTYYDKLRRKLGLTNKNY